MPETWFTADTHFGHAAIIGHCNRPFADVDEMDAALIANINETVAPNDTLYHLGDFAFRHSKFDEYRAGINCRNIHLIFGNHDREKEGKKFASAAHGAYLRYNGRRFSLSHYPMASWRNSHHGAIHLHGHCHGTHEEWKEAHMPGALSFDVGVDVRRYKPINADILLSLAAIKAAVCPAFSADHHNEDAAPPPAGAESIAATRKE